MLKLKGKKVLVTGGLGFIGSNLTIQLVKLGASVTVVDNMTPHQGGNTYNIHPVRNDVNVNFADVRDSLTMNQLVLGQDYVFHLARQTDHILSLTDPYVDIDVNVRGTAVLLEALKKHNKKAKLIYTGTRGQYGKAINLPVPETAPTNPKGIYELTNLTAEHMIKIYHDVHGIKAVMLRLTNIYGPRSQMKHDHYGVVNWFVRLAIEGKTIPVFGDGSLKRDFIYVDDAIDAILTCARIKSCYGEVINVGDDSPSTFLELTKKIVQIAGSGRYKLAPFTPERAAQEPGHFASDITKIERLTGWRPRTRLDSGLKKTISFYKKHRKHYW